MSFRGDLRDAVASPDVGAIVLDVDSPGGLNSLVLETAAEVAAARGTKPIVAVANTMAASAAYWIASQADELVVTPSGDVGSIGVYMLHEDWSGFNEQSGIDPTYIYAGQYKVEGNMDEPLSEGAQAAWQQEVDDIYAEFITAVATGRGVSEDTVRNDFGQGRTLRASAALQAGMVDRVDTIENVIAELLKPSGGAAARAAALRAQIEAAEQEIKDPAELSAFRGTLGLEDGPATPPDPSHEPEGTPPVEPPADPVEPDSGPDAPPEEPPGPDVPEVDPAVQALRRELLLSQS